MRHIIPILICSNNDFSNLSVRLVWVYTANEFQEIPWVELPVMRQQERVRLPWPEARCPTGMGTLGTKYGLVWWLPKCQMPYWEQNPHRVPQAFPPASALHSDHSTPERPSTSWQGMVSDNFTSDNFFCNHSRLPVRSCILASAFSLMFFCLLTLKQNICVV